MLLGTRCRGVRVADNLRTFFAALREISKVANGDKQNYCRQGNKNDSHHQQRVQASITLFLCRIGLHVSLKVQERERSRPDCHAGEGKQYGQGQAENRLLDRGKSVQSG